MKGRSLRKRVLFSLIMLGIVLVVTECMAGLATWLFIKPMEVSRGLLAHPNLAPHPYRSYMLRPGQPIWKPGMDSGVVNGMELDFGLIPGGVVTNEFGHQVLPSDLELQTQSKQPNEYRILFLGGSTTFQSWPFFVGEDLTRRNIARTFKIINASAGGYTSQENLIDLIVSGFSYEPNMVVAYLPVNDIGYAAHYPGFKRDYTHMRIPLRTFLSGERPTGVIRRYPFVLRLFDTVIYNRRMEDYVKQASLNYVTTRHPDPMSNGHTVDPDDFDKTSAAVIDNIFDMKTLCESRGIRFVLFTQKMFKVDHPYESVIYDRTLECSRRIAASQRLRGIVLFDMQSLFPEEWDDASRALVRASFPNRAIDFDQRLSYDDMHFTPGGLFLFAAIVVERISPLIE